MFYIWLIVTIFDTLSQWDCGFSRIGKVKDYVNNDDDDDWSIVFTSLIDHSVGIRFV